MDQDRDDDPIPEEVAEAFWEAVYLFTTWDAVGGEPLVTRLGTPTPISAVCERAAEFKDPLPNGVLDQLNNEAVLMGTPRPENSYVSAAQCLGNMIIRKAARPRNQSRPV
jgi:hypothetical protein